MGPPDVSDVSEAEVEAAARAMYERHFNRPTDRPWDECGPQWRHSYIEDAGAALLAAARVNDA